MRRKEKKCKETNFIPIYPDREIKIVPIFNHQISSLKFRGNLKFENSIDSCKYAKLLIKNTIERIISSSLPDDITNDVVSLPSNEGRKKK